MKNLDPILAFVRVVEKKSFSAAAKDLKVSASVVSKLVGLLEKELGKRVPDFLVQFLELSRDPLKPRRRPKLLPLVIMIVRLGVQSLNGLHQTVEVIKVGLARADLYVDDELVEMLRQGFGKEPLRNHIMFFGGKAQAIHQMLHFGLSLLHALEEFNFLLAGKQGEPAYLVEVDPERVP